LSDATLTADNAVVPIAYYLHTRQLGDAYLTSGKHSMDRLQVRNWVYRTLLKRSVWGGASDTLLARLRTVLRDTRDQDGFPAVQLAENMAAAGRSLDFTQADVDELIELQYAKARTFPVLALLYPGLDLSQQFHEDHIFPKSQFTRTKLVAQGMTDQAINACIPLVNGLPNLQLLAGQQNIEKSDTWPWDWITGNHFPSPEAREAYRERNDLDLLPDDVTGFLSFYRERRKRLAIRLTQELGANPN
jgi:hypothetical protein